MIHRKGSNSLKNTRFSNLPNRSIIRVAAVTALILLVPFLAMLFDWQVTDPGSPTPEQVNWSPSDFVIAGVLLLGTGLVYELLAGRMQTTVRRAVLALVLGGILFLIWAELAVGIFGTPFAGL